MMTIKFNPLFILFTLLFLFYPGESLHYNFFAFNHTLLADEKPYVEVKLNPYPVVKNQSVPAITAEGAYIVDLDSFTPIFEKNSRSRFFPASTTKVITALVVLDLFQPDDIITVKRQIGTGQVMGLIPGERITVEYLLYGLLVYSGNDAAYAFADYYGYDKFIDLMNKKAKDLGMTSSQFRNPAGLDDSNQYVSPYDLALASRVLLKNKLLSKIVSTKEITISDVDYKVFHRLENVNKLLGEIPGIGGLKTGYTEIAKENLVSFYKKDGKQFLIVLLKSDDRFADTKEVVRWIDENVTFRALPSKI